MDLCAQETIQQIDATLLQIKRLEEDGQAADGGTEDMRNATAYLQDRQHNLDRQRQRTFILDKKGIYVWDAENPKNIGKANIVLSRQARELNDQIIQTYTKGRRQVMENLGSLSLVDTEAASATSSPRSGAASSYAQPADVPPAPCRRTTPTNRRPATPGRERVRDPWDTTWKPPPPPPPPPPAPKPPRVKENLTSKCPSR